MGKCTENTHRYTATTTTTIYIIDALSNGPKRGASFIHICGNRT